MPSLGKQLMDFIEGCESDGVELIAGEYYGEWHWNKDAEVRINEWLDENTDKINLIGDDQEPEETHDGN